MSKQKSSNKAWDELLNDSVMTDSHRSISFGMAELAKYKVKFVV